ncbi:MAG: GGDEF domain-containing protein [Candidatus Aminicenantales bacterium]
MKLKRVFSHDNFRFQGDSLFERMFVDDELRTHIQTIIACGLLAVAAVVMSLINLAGGARLMAFTAGAFALLGLLCLAVTIISGSQAFASGVMAVALLALFCLFLYDGGVDGFSPIWICLLPGIGMIFFGLRKGAILGAIMLAVIAAVLWTPLAEVIPYAYSKTFRIRFPIVYLSCFTIAFALEYFRCHTQKRLEESNKKLEAMSLVDELTGIENRRSFDHKLEEAWNFALRTDGRLSLLMIDIDYFKSYNDHYGHPAGDKVLVKVAKAVSGAVSRKTDTVARWNGEEFAVLLPFADPLGAGNVALAARDAIEKLRIPHKKTPLPQKFLTVSIGVSTIRPKKGKSLLELLDLADQVLYTAKKNGRDRVETDFVGA